MTMFNLVGAIGAGVIGSSGVATGEPMRGSPPSFQKTGKEGSSC